MSAFNLSVQDVLEQWHTAKRFTRKAKWRHIKQLPAKPIPLMTDMQLELNKIEACMTRTSGVLGYKRHVAGSFCGRRLLAQAGSYALSGYLIPHEGAFLFDMEVLAYLLRIPDGSVDKSPLIYFHATHQ